MIRANFADNSMQSLDDTDRLMIRLLRADGRMSNAALAEAVGLSPSACLRRLRLLEHRGVIRGYTALVEAPFPRDGTVVIVQITLERQTDEHLKRFEAAVRGCPEVRECYLMTGHRDYLLRVVVSDLTAYERFLKQKLTRLDGISSIESSFALGQLKHANALPIPKPEPPRAKRA